MAKSRSSKPKKHTAAAGPYTRHAAQHAAVKQAKTRHRKNMKSKITELTMELDSQHAELQTSYIQNPHPAPMVALDSTANDPATNDPAAIGDLAEVLRGL